MTKEVAIDVLKSHYHKNPRTIYGLMVKQATEMAIEALQERKTGKWIDSTEDGYVECPVCGHLTTCWREDEIEGLHYCFWCGAKMEVGE